MLKDDKERAALGLSPSSCLLKTSQADVDSNLSLFQRCPTRASAKAVVHKQTGIFGVTDCNVRVSLSHFIEGIVDFPQGSRCSSYFEARHVTTFSDGLGDSDAANESV